MPDRVVAETGEQTAKQTRTDTASEPAIKTPVTLIAGYLGAGKTTLINACLKTRGGRKIAVLVNDFGDINIDAALIESQTDTVINLAGGCVCCSIGSDFMEALFELAALPNRFDHVLVEGSGIALPGPLVQSISLTQSFQVESVLVVADAVLIEKQLRDPYIGQTVKQQLDQADWVLLSKLPPETHSPPIGFAPSVAEALKAAGCAVPVFAVPQSDYSCDWLLGFVDSTGSLSLPGQVSSQGSMTTSSARRGMKSWLTRPSGTNRLSTQLAAADSNGFDSLSIEMDAPLDLTVISPVLLRLASGHPPALLRAKGLVRDRADPDQLLILQMVGNRLIVTTHKDRQPELPITLGLVLIGLKDEMKSRQAELESLIELLQL
jgi:G3E family GTPase